MARPTNLRFAVAVHLLTLLTESPATLVDSRELAVSPATNPVQVRRVLGRLRDEGLVSSRSGRRGGWTLARPAAQINLGEVWRAVNGGDPLFGLHVPDQDCPTGRRVLANLRALDLRAVDVVVAELEGVTIADMLNDPHVATLSAPPASDGARRR
ncbi:MAG: Rrf2 family transcriptional regulator [Acidobacteria bacterium]|nr:Rrf2 family transcriptional regulator [Acidobacteriota bacterium]